MQKHNVKREGRKERGKRLFLESGSGHKGAIVLSLSSIPSRGDGRFCTHKHTRMIHPRGGGSKRGITRRGETPFFLPPPPLTYVCPNYVAEESYAQFS